MSDLELQNCRIAELQDLEFLSAILQSCNPAIPVFL